MNEEPAVLIDVEEGIGTITFNRPDVLNTWAQIGSGLFDALRKLDQDDDVRAIVVTGKGRAFCAGADLSGRRPTGDREAGDQPQRPQSAPLAST